MRRLRRSTLLLLATLGSGCGDDKDPTLTSSATTPTASMTGDSASNGDAATDAPTTGGDEGTTGNASNPTTDPTTATTATTANPSDPSTTGMTTDDTATTATTANPTTDPTSNPTTDPSTTANPTTDPTGDPTGDPDEAATQLCVDTINMYRATLGLPAYQRWTDAETCSDGEAQSDGESNTAHGAFGTCGEFAQNECPGWPAPPETMIEGCLAQMWAEGPGDDFPTHGHYINMSSQSYTKVACGFAIVDGEVWAVQNFQ